MLTCGHLRDRVPVQHMLKRREPPTTSYLGGQREKREAVSANETTEKHQTHRTSHSRSCTNTRLRFFHGGGGFSRLLSSYSYLLHGVGWNGTRTRAAQTQVHRAHRATVTAKSKNICNTGSKEKRMAFLNAKSLADEPDTVEKPSTSAVHLWQKSKASGGFFGGKKGKLILAVHMDHFGGPRHQRVNTMAAPT